MWSIACGGEHDQADTGYYVTDEWCNTSSQSSSYMHIYLPFTGGFESVFACWFTNLSWHIAGFVTIAKFQNTQVAQSSPEIAMQVSHMPAISPARAANVTTHAWTKLYDEIVSLISGIYESQCRSCHARLALPEVTSTNVHICITCEWPAVDGP